MTINQRKLSWRWIDFTPFWRIQTWPCIVRKSTYKSNNQIGDIKCSAFRGRMMRERNSHCSFTRSFTRISNSKSQIMASSTTVPPSSAATSHHSASSTTSSETWTLETTPKTAHTKGVPSSIVSSKRFATWKFKINVANSSDSAPFYWDCNTKLFLIINVFSGWTGRSDQCR